MQRLIKNLNLIWNRVKGTNQKFWEELEEQLISSDVSVDTTGSILGEVKDHVHRENIKDIGKIKNLLKEQVSKILNHGQAGKLNISPDPPTVFLIVGVNGTGKTTTIAKIAKMFQDGNKKILIAAADTYRAAAVEQIKYYTNKLRVDLVHHQRNSDPGAVVYDSIEKAKARGIDLVIIDTAGRMQTSFNLMEELKKIKKVIVKNLGRDADEIMLTIDSTTGQNAKSQAKIFNDALSLTGVILTKTDGTSKGGIVITIKNDLKIPIKLIANGEKLDDISYFDPLKFTDLLFS